MGFQASLKYILITIIIEYSNGSSDGDTLLRTKNLGSINDTFLTSLIEPVKNLIPVFNESTVPNLDEVIKDFESGTNNEDQHLNITQILTKYGYNPEQHQVKTSDGYLLDIFRIPGDGPQILFMHGILSSSDDFIVTGPEIGLPYLLADLGYDVWLGNARGTVHGRNHVTLSPDSAKFWQFTWHEIGILDTPAIIDYILEKTNKTKLTYIGHSQGTTTFFVMASELPEYNDKISLMIALSPVSYLSHTRSPFLQVISKLTDPINALLQAVGSYEIVPRNQITSAFTTIACGTPELATIFCNNIAFLVNGADYTQINATILPPYYGHYPAGAGTRQLAHFGQLIYSGRFCQYDHHMQNFDKYGSATPPDYPVEKITCRMVVFTADNDVYYSAPADRSKFLARLPNLMENIRVDYAEFSHMDFLIARDVRKLVYNKVVEILLKYF